MPRLSGDEFAATFQSPMGRISQDESAPFDFWSYFDLIPTEDFEGHDCAEGGVDYVYRHPEARLEHVLVNSSTPDIYMVIVIDRVSKTVIGHHLLDLPNLFGISGSLQPIDPAP